jgi:hypothetical protein
VAEGSSSSSRKQKRKKGKNQVMVVSFNWYKYSVVIGFLKKKVNTAVIPEYGGSGSPDRLEPGEDFFHLANKAKSELKMGIRRSAIRKEGKRELLLSICRLLAPYTALTALQAYPFRVAINNVIITETARYCSIHLSSEELLTMWREAGPEHGERADQCSP